MILGNPLTGNAKHFQIEHGRSGICRVWTFNAFEWSCLATIPNRNRTGRRIGVRGTGRQWQSKDQSAKGATWRLPVLSRFLRIRLQAVCPVRIRNLAAQDFMSSLDS